MNYKLHNELLDVNWNDMDSIIDMYEKNLVYFKNYNEKENLEDIEEIADIKLEYIFALDKKKHYSKAYECLKDIHILIDRLKDSEFYTKINEKYLFAFGVIEGRLDKIEESQKYFAILIKTDPDNDLYTNWYQYNKDALFYKKNKFIGYTGFFLFICILFSDLVITYDRSIKLMLEFISFLIMILGFNAVAIKKLFRKYKIVYK